MSHLSIFENEVFKKKKKNGNGEWETVSAFKSQKVIKIIINARLKLTGHVKGMDENEWAEGLWKVNRKELEPKGGKRKMDECDAEELIKPETKGIKSK